MIEVTQFQRSYAESGRDHSGETDLSMWNTECSGNLEKISETVDGGGLTPELNLRTNRLMGRQDRTQWDLAKSFEREL